MPKKQIYKFTILLVFCFPATLVLPWNETLDDLNLSLYYQMGTSQILADHIFFVYIGADDIEELGGWPISRDYYGYLVHLLSQVGARIIGFDILFESLSRTFPEYDTILADYFRTSGNVCLSMAFSELSTPSRPGEKENVTFRNMLHGENPVFPCELYRDQTAGIGFSNLGGDVFPYKVPLIVSYSDSILLSFGAELARLYWGAKPVIPAEQVIIFQDEKGRQHPIPLDRRGNLLLKHIPVDKFKAMGFVELLHALRENPDSLKLSDKIVLVGVSAPGLPTLKATPLSSATPASLIHAAVAENILHNQFLRILPSWVKIILIVVMVLSPWYLLRHVTSRPRHWLLFAIAPLFMAAGFFMFHYMNVFIPVFYPLGGFLTSWITAAQMSRRENVLYIKRLLKRQIVLKSQELQGARAELEKTKELLVQEIEGKKALSNEKKQLAEEKQRAVFELEKHLRDLQQHDAGPKRKSKITLEIVHAPDGKMSDIIEMIKKVAPDDIPILILGETGTGKELVARAIQQSGPRAQQPFVAINCGALPETLLESELFGHEKGSFTGAVGRRRGHFERADGGTLFLDEISETSQAFQTKLLRVLQEKTFFRLGSEEPIYVDVRIIAASNKQLKEEVDNGRFRADLFYRLNGIILSIPPLHERREDIPILANHFLKKLNLKKPNDISEQAMCFLESYHWPGNVRELENIVHRAALLAKGENRDMIRMKDLPEAIRNTPGINLEYIPLEEQIIQSLRALRFSHAAVSQTAQTLGNRDRGTITEYFRGMCFEQLAAANFDVALAARKLADNDDDEAISRVANKIETYIQNVKSWNESAKEGEKSGELPAPFKGLPKKYHPYLEKLLKHIC